MRRAEWIRLCRLSSYGVLAVCRERLGDDLAVAHDEGVGAERDLTARAPGDVGQVAVDSQGPQRETFRGPRRQRGDEVREEIADLLLPVIGPGFAVEPRIVVIVTQDGGDAFLLQEGLQVIADDSFGSGRVGAHDGSLLGQTCVQRLTMTDFQIFARHDERISFPPC